MNMLLSVHCLHVIFLCKGTPCLISRPKNVSRACIISFVHRKYRACVDLLQRLSALRVVFQGGSPSIVKEAMIFFSRSFARLLLTLELQSPFPVSCLLGLALG